MQSLRIYLAGEEILLHPLRVLFHAKEKTMLLADLHLGKARHFRRGGIPTPLEANQKDLQNLESLIEGLQPKRILFLGDLFHSELNADWEVFTQFIKRFPDIAFELVEGNHDILARRHYEASGIKLHAIPLPYGPFLLSHEPLKDIPKGSYNLCGHIHPGVTLAGKGRQRLRLPCFFFGERQGILPAFGQMTGAVRLEPKREDRVYVIAREQVVQVGA